MKTYFRSDFTNNFLLYLSIRVHSAVSQAKPVAIAEWDLTFLRQIRTHVIFLNCVTLKIVT